MISFPEKKKKKKKPCIRHIYDTYQCTVNNFETRGVIIDSED